MGNRLYFANELDVRQKHVEAGAKPAPEAITSQFHRGILWETVLSVLWIALGRTLALTLALG
jgi:hypothetical protein